MYKCSTVICSGLEAWISDVILYETFPTCVYLFRESVHTAYLFFKNQYRANTALIYCNNLKIDPKKFPQEWINRPLINNQQETFITKSSKSVINSITVEFRPKEKPVVITLTAAQNFLENRWTTIHKTSFIPNQPATKYLKIVSSCKLNLNEWMELVPNAYMIHKTRDLPKVFAEFTSAEHAYHAAVYLLQNAHYHFVKYHNEEIAIKFGVCFVEEHQVYQKAQPVNEKIAEHIKYDEYLGNKIVAFLDL